MNSTEEMKRTSDHQLSQIEDQKVIEVADASVQCELSSRGLKTQSVQTVMKTTKSQFTQTKSEEEDKKKSPEQEAQEELKESEGIQKQTSRNMLDFIQKNVMSKLMIPPEIKEVMMRNQFPIQEGMELSELMNGEVEVDRQSSPISKSKKKKRSKKPEWKKKANELIKEGTERIKLGNIPWSLEINFKAFLLFKENQEKLGYDLKQNLRKTLQLQSLRQYNDCKFDKAAQASYIILQEIDEGDVNAQYIYGLSLFEEGMYDEAAQNLEAAYTFIGNKMEKAKERAKDSPKRVIKFMKREVVELVRR